MNILNQDFDFQRDASAEDQEAFWGRPSRVLLQPRTTLRRLITAQSETERGNELYLSPWWYPPETWHHLSRAAQNLGLSIPTVARTQLAVQERWNPELNWLCTIELIHPAWAWRGRIRYQPTEQGSTVLLPGGPDQVYLPHLARGDGDVQERNSSDYAMILYCGRIA